MIANTRQLLSLDGEWEMILPTTPADRPAEPATPPSDLGATASYRTRHIHVPTCWEREGVPKSYPGPVWYRRTFAHVVAAAGERVFLRFHAVSTVATVWLNGALVGRHRGMWDAFELHVTDRLARGAPNTVVLEVHKPGGLFPVKASLAGFVPYVTTTFGGVWQTVELVAAPAYRVHDLWVQPRLAEGRIEVSGRVERTGADRGPLRLSLANGAQTLVVEVPADAGLRATLSTGSQTAWSPESPALNTLTVTVAEGGPPAVVRYGLRDVASAGTQVHLNGEPRYLRGALHWVAYTDLISPTPDRARIEHEMRSVRELGYNLIKLCLVVPWDLYFEVADELGMMLWVELPLWMPQMDAGFSERAHAEYAAMVRSIRNHPSVVVWTLGCELDRAVDGPTLKSLYDLVRRESGSSLVRDNSGSPECYGGVEVEYADFHDYHFYAEANQFQDLMDYFVPHWKEKKPLLFGEYCDCDTFRSIVEEYGETPPWWSKADPVENPQGVRWDYNITTSVARMTSAPPPVSVAEMRRRSYTKALEYRKDIVEQTRRRADTAGYVVTNIQDTPLSTSGMLDDRGAVKYDPVVFRRFNADTVIAAEVERRRVWRNGGDRPQVLDEWCLAAPGRLRRRIVISHFGRSADAGRLVWTLRLGDRVLGEGVFPDVPLQPGRVVLAGTADVIIPAVDAPAVVLLDVRLAGPSGELARGEWRYWLLPERPARAPAAADVSVWDPRGSLVDLDKVLPGTRRVGSPGDVAAGTVLISTVHHPELRRIRESGTPLLLVLDGAEASYLEPCPFFREGIAVVLPHPILDGLPHRGYGGIHWKGVAPDRALAPAALERELGVPMAQVMARYDARTFLTTSYLLASKDRGAKVIATTLRLAGGHGRQPAGLEHNVLGRHLLLSMLDRLQA